MEGAGTVASVEVTGTGVLEPAAAVLVGHGIKSNRAMHFSNYQFIRVGDGMSASERIR